MVVLFWNFTRLYEAFDNLFDNFLPVYVFKLEAYLLKNKSLRRIIVTFFNTIFTKPIQSCLHSRASKRPLILKAQILSSLHNWSIFFTFEHYKKTMNFLIATFFHSVYFTTTHENIRLIDYYCNFNNILFCWSFNIFFNKSACHLKVKNCRIGCETPCETCWGMVVKIRYKPVVYCDNKMGF